MTTKILPTDKHGNVYYGPRTYDQAEQWISDAAHNGRESIRAAARRVVPMLAGAGYVGVANRVRRAYEVSE